MNTFPAILAHESKSEFDAVAARLRADLLPTGEHETFLVDQMVAARWRLARIDRLEAAAFDHILDPSDAPPSNNDARIVAHLCGKNSASILGTLERLAAAAERSYHKCYRELLHSRQLAQRMYQKAMNNYVKNVVFAPLPGESLPGQTGSASPKPPSPDPELGSLRTAPSTAAAPNGFASPRT